MEPGPVAAHHLGAYSSGARCDVCPLHQCGAGPVPPSLPLNGRIRLLVVGEAPGPQEVNEGRPFVGPSGREVRTALNNAGFDHAYASYTNAILCRPSGGDLDAYLRWCKKNKFPSPIDCCKPRLKNELGNADYAIFVGGAAVRAAGVADSVMAVRGTPLRSYTGLATVHPAYVLRDQGRVMRPVFHADIAKAVRIATRGSTWREPNYHIARTAADISRFVSVPRPYWAIDTETDGIDPWTCRIRRIGIGDDNDVLIYAPLSVHGNKLYDSLEIQNELRMFFAQPHAYAFHNFYAYDSIVLAQHGLPVNETGVFDSLLGHHIGGTSELPHGLDFLASIWTDAPRWKDDVKHSNTKDDETLDKYLSYDIATTHIVARPVQHNLTNNAQWPIYDLDTRLSRIGRSMSALGVRIDEAQRHAYIKEFSENTARLLSEFTETIRQVTKDPNRTVNPRSYPQITRLLYGDLGLPILDEHLTDTGEPSTAEPVLLDLLERGLDERARKIIHALLSYREYDKLLGTYLGRIDDEPTSPTRGSVVGGPSTHRDGRLRSTWKVFGTKSGRWSSGDPFNLTNVPKRLRAMFVPADGHVFVGADYSALELRMQAFDAMDEPLIKAFAEFDAGRGPDIHKVNTMAIFQCKLEEVSDKAREFGKRYVYAGQYGAHTERIFTTLSLLRDDKLNPVFPGIERRDIEAAGKAYYAAHPAIVKWRNEQKRNWRKHGFIQTYWHGRKRYFIGGEDEKELWSHRIQGSAADLQNNAILAFTSRVPFEFSERTGLVLEVHDALVAECREDEAQSISTTMEESMSTTVGPMAFVAKAKIGKNWKEVS